MRKIIVSLTAVLSLAATPARATDWVEVKTQHFIIYGKRSNKDLPKLAMRLEQLNKLLNTVLPMGGRTTAVIERPLLVYVVPEAEVRGNAKSTSAAGFYASDRRNGYAVVRSGVDHDVLGMGQEPILFHEFAHHFMLANASVPFPAWYVEGFAEFFATLRFQDDHTILFGNLPLYRAPQLVTRSLYPLNKLLRQRPGALGLEEGDRYYGAAWLLVHYLFMTPARGKEFQAYVNDLSSPGGARDIATYFEGGEKALSRELETYKKSRLHGYSTKAPMDGVAAPQIRALSPDENATLVQELRFKRYMGEADVKALAAQVQATAAGFKGSAHAQAFLAEVQADIGDWPAAIAAADAALKIDPDNARAHAAKAEALWGKAKDAGGPIAYAPILDEIISANHADVEDPYPLYLYYALKRDQGSVPDMALNGLHKTYLQLPQNVRYRRAFAEALADRKDYANAIVVITPLANDPHGGRSAVAAQHRRDVFIALRDGKPEPVFKDEDDAADGKSSSARAGS